MSQLAEAEVVAALRSIRSELRNVGQQQDRTARSADKMNRSMARQIDRYKNQVRSLKRELREGARSQGIFNRRMGEGNTVVGGLIRRFGGLAAAMTAAFRVGQKALQDQTEAGGRKSAGASQRQRLLGLAATPAEAQDLLSASNRTRAETGVSQTEADKFQFTLASFGLGSSRRNLARLSLTGEDPNAVVTGAARLGDPFGIRRGPELERLINQVITASESMSVGATEAANALSEIGEIARTVGSSPEEVLSIASQFKGDPRRLATNLTALATAAKREGFEAGLIAFARDVASRGLSPRDLVTAVGGVEGLKGLEFINARRGPIRDRRQTLRSDSAGAVGRRLDVIREGDPTTFEQVLADIAEQKADLAGEDRLGTEAALQRQRDATFRRIRERRGGRLASFLKEPISETFFTLGGENILDVFRDEEDLREQIGGLESSPEIKSTRLSTREDLVPTKLIEVLSNIEVNTRRGGGVD